MLSPRFCFGKSSNRALLFPESLRTADYCDGYFAFNIIVSSLSLPLFSLFLFREKVIIRKIVRAFPRFDEN